MQTGLALPRTSHSHAAPSVRSALMFAEMEFSNYHLLFYGNKKKVINLKDTKII